MLALSTKLDFIQVVTNIKCKKTRTECRSMLPPACLQGQPFMDTVIQPLKNPPSCETSRISSPYTKGYIELSVTHIFTLKTGESIHQVYNYCFNL